MTQYTYMFEKPSSMLFRMWQNNSHFAKINRICLAKHENIVFILNLIFFMPASPTSNKMFLQMEKIGVVVYCYFAQYFCCKNHVLLTNNILYFVEEPFLLKSPFCWSHATCVYKIFANYDKPWKKYSPYYFFFPSDYRRSKKLSHL